MNLYMQGSSLAGKDSQLDKAVKTCDLLGRLGSHLHANGCLQPPNQPRRTHLNETIVIYTIAVQSTVPGCQLQLVQ